MLCWHCFREVNTDGPCPHCGFDGRDQADRYPLALRPGSILNGRYTVGRVLGQGGFGITYIALDDKTGDRVAIKEYLPTDFAGRVAGSSSVQVYSGERRENFEYGMERFLDEAKTLAEFIGDTHIVRIYSYFEENATAYFVMEYVDGTPLDKYMRANGGRLGVEDAAALLLPLMDSLGRVHAKGVVHRDIAPDNIIIERSGEAKLIDFGAARYSTGEKSKSLDVILKHGFAPMEQYARHGRQGPFTDVYAMAATFYYAITGKIPPDAIDRLYEDPLAAPSTLGVKISDAAEAVLFRALEVPAQQRYQSMAEFHRDMDAVLTAERLERERKEREIRREQERLKREQEQREREEAERLERERLERERREQEEAERLERERLERERREQEEAERLERERKAREAKAESERLKREQKEREAREKAERRAQEKAAREAKKAAAKTAEGASSAAQEKKKSPLPLILAAAVLVIAALVFGLTRGGSKPSSPAVSTAPAASAESTAASTDSAAPTESVPTVEPSASPAADSSAALPVPTPAASPVPTPAASAVTAEGLPVNPVTPYGIARLREMRDGAVYTQAEKYTIFDRTSLSKVFDGIEFHYMNNTELGYNIVFEYYDGMLAWVQLSDSTGPVVGFKLWGGELFLKSNSSTGIAYLRSPWSADEDARFGAYVEEHLSEILALGDRAYTEKPGVKHSYSDLVTLPLSGRELVNHTLKVGGVSYKSFFAVKVGQPDTTFREYTITLRVTNAPDNYSFGDHVIFAETADGEWKEFAWLRIEKEQADGRSVSYGFYTDSSTPISITRLSTPRSLHPPTAGGIYTCKYEMELTVQTEPLG